MGLKFIENAGGTNMFFCLSCYTYLADKEACVSETFTGTTGPAYLFKKVVNVSLGKMAVREMMTGTHYVRDVLCLGCENVLGWMYEMSPTERERYKEGHIILERGLIREGRSINTHDQLVLGRDAMSFDPSIQTPMAELIRQRRLVDIELNFGDVFKFDNGIPVITIFDAEHVQHTFMYTDEQMETTQNRLTSLNEAIVACSQGDNNPLWDLGFRQDYARQFPEIRDTMNGQPYRPSRVADNNLIQLLDRMASERERERFHRADPNDPIYRQFQQQHAQMYTSYVETYRGLAEVTGIPMVQPIPLEPADQGVAFRQIMLGAAQLRAHREERDRRLGIRRTVPAREAVARRDFGHFGPTLVHRPRFTDGVSSDDDDEER